MSTNSLFNPSFLKRKLPEYRNIDSDKIKNAREIFERWNNLLQTTTKNEEQLQTDFLNDIFGDILGYAYKRGETETNLEKEEKTELDGQKPDGILGFFTHENKNCRVVIELKDQKTSLDAKQNRQKDNRTPVEQAFGYVSKYQGTEFVIVSNFKEIRLYKSNYQGKYHEFKIEELARSEAKQREFFLLLSKNNLFTTEKSTSPTHKLLEDNTKEEESIEKRFYNDYKDLRKKLFNHLREQNPTKEPTNLLSKTQKLLDRVIFVCFCEDLNLLPDKIFTKLLKTTQEAFVEITIWQQIKGLFNAIDKGGREKNINKFNGGLFARDIELDELVLQDDILKEIIKISDWDFGSELTVNILGHIFEQSITDLEEIKADISGETHDKKQGKRKKDGVFYTPEYITRYIVEEAVGGWLNDRKTELEIDKLPELTEDDLVKKSKKPSKKAQIHIDFWNSYAKTLQSIKVLDPACGSGAFLVAVFNFLEKEWLTLSETLRKLGDDEQAGLFSYSQIYKHILKNNIYGVDLNPESVQITKLSLWLKTANRSEELTTLDANIKCGNSLIDDASVETGFYINNEGERVSLAFNWQNEFSAVSENGGFDVVVGNPPYGVDFDEKQKEYLSNFDSSVPDYEIYIYFISKGMYLLKNGGKLFYIFPNTFLSTLYGANYRKQIIDNHSLICIANLSDDKTFDEANVRTCICGFQKGIKDYKCTVTEYTNKFDIVKTITKQDLLDNHENLLSFISVNEDAKRIIDKIKIHSKLSDFFDVSQGYIPYDKYRGQSEETIKNRIYHSTTKLDEAYKIEIKGEDVKPYYLNLETGQYVKYGKHLANPREQKYFINPRVLIREIVSQKLIATYTEEECYNNPSVINVIAKDKNELSLAFILGIINSKLIGFYHNVTSPKAKKGLFPKILINDIRNLPIPNIPLTDQHPFVEKAQTMLTLTAQLNDKTKAFVDYFVGKFKAKLPVDKEFKITRNLENWHTLEFADFIKELAKQKVSLSSTDEFDFKPLFDREKKACVELQSKITRTDAEIDKMVYTLYGLSEEEVKIVENLVV
ncbi:Eco57I restriction-modification methylase domain-containing protein [Candidatus Deianiraea vastatrix]|uniref:site-specific DNA-methyltransferase (adenine-specific) n=1 Tax=Candidatus Deianiraea vastatrix TaxID=2163644 RepID=A0A5B8XDQ3_9RICK|nr:TaqI-like C-terminal specificity domain-containing protein [Candidatus Deianiraea vastatrix]QED23005.1 Putative Type IIS restriction/modification enzyme [Candidatus Deianiraea vastatrix]